MTYSRNNEVIHNLPQKMKKRTMLHLVYEASKILLSKPEDILSQKNCDQISPLNKDTKILHKILANQTHQYIRIINYVHTESYIPGHMYHYTWKAR